MGQMTRDELEVAFIRLSQSPRPANESVSCLLYGDDLVPEYSPKTRRIETFVDHICKFDDQLRGIDMESKDIMKDSLIGIMAEVVVTVRMALDEVGSGEGRMTLDERLEPWKQGHITLIIMCTAFAEKIDLEQMGEDWIRRTFNALFTAFKSLSSDFLKLKTEATPEQLSEIAEYTEWWSEAIEAFKELSLELGEDDEESGGADEGFEWVGSPTDNVDEVHAVMNEQTQGTNTAMIDFNPPLTTENSKRLQPDTKSEAQQSQYPNSNRE
jgi:hypothetical protein